MKTIWDKMDLAIEKRDKDLFDSIIISRDIYEEYCNALYDLCFPENRPLDKTIRHYKGYKIFILEDEDYNP